MNFGESGTRKLPPAAESISLPEVQSPEEDDPQRCTSTTWKTLFSNQAYFANSRPFCPHLFRPAFYRNREIDVFDRITSHKLPETSIFASDFGDFTTVGW